jgi:hypothetical protein
VQLSAKAVTTLEPESFTFWKAELTNKNMSTYFTESDLTLLASIWKDLPAADGDRYIEERHYETYITSFENSPERPEWKLAKSSRGGDGIAYRVCVLINKKRHTEELVKMLKKRTLRARHSNGVEASYESLDQYSQAQLDDLELTDDQVKIFFASLGLETASAIAKTDVLEARPNEIEAQPVESMPLIAPLQRQTAQVNFICEEIRKLGHDPLKLPKARPGNKGVKATIKGMALKNKTLFSSDSVFKKAWERCNLKYAT